MKRLISISTKIFTGIFTAILLFALFLNISTLWAVDRIKNGGEISAGYFCAVISSGSMETAVSINDLLIIQGGDSFEEGDIVTYVSARGSLVTHRVKEITDNGYITQGDANNIPDGEISAQIILGKVVFILQGAGNIQNFFPIIIVLLIGIPLSVRLLKKMRRNKHEKK